MRLALIIVTLTAVAVVNIHLERQTKAAQCEVNRLEQQSLGFKRQMWDQQVQLSQLISPSHVVGKTDELKMVFVDPFEAAQPVVARPPVRVAAAPARHHR